MTTSSANKRLSCQLINAGNWYCVLGATDDGEFVGAGLPNTVATQNNIMVVYDECGLPWVHWGTVELSSIGIQGVHPSANAIVPFVSSPEFVRQTLPGLKKNCPSLAAA